jgi:uncharacterized membrane protein YvbJ
MQCRQCGTEIADKAIICFRCGAGTTDPVRKAAPIRPKRSPLLGLAVVVLLVLLALYLGQASRTAQDPGTLQMLAAGAVGVALVLLVSRILRRR